MVGCRVVDRPSDVPSLDMVRLSLHVMKGGEGCEVGDVDVGIVPGVGAGLRRTGMHGYCRASHTCDAVRVVVVAVVSHFFVDHRDNASASDCLSPPHILLLKCQTVSHREAT